MDTEIPSWLQSYQQPYVKKQNVQCKSGHIHQQNMPAAGFVFVRLNEAMKIDVLLDLRSKTVADGNTWGFIGGYANDLNEDDLAVAYREALEEYGITRDEIKPLGLTYKRDHGGIKYLTYSYIFAEYTPLDGKAPAPLSHESVRSQWFSLDGGAPDNLHKYIIEDRNMIDHVLKEMVWPMLVEAKGLDRPNASPQQGQAPQQGQSPQQPGANTPGQVQYPALPIREGPDVGMADISQVIQKPAIEQNNAAQQPAPSPKKPAEPAGQLKIPKSSPKAIARRGTSRGTARKSKLQRGILGKKEGGAQPPEVAEGKRQPDKVSENQAQRGQTEEEEKGGETTAAKPDNDLPRASMFSWLNIFRSRKQEPVTENSPPPPPPPPATVEKQGAGKGKELAPAPAAEEPVPSSQSSSDHSEPIAMPKTPAPKKAAPRPRRMPGAATPGTDPALTPSSGSKLSLILSPTPPVTSPTMNPFSPVRLHRTLDSSFGGKETLNPFVTH
ncbi:hypothetical protein F5X97DRAFT_319278 [Nemania serpens]|nr:hypothetical protein F5X97DRAFT_319278 [Nemania serpens]